MAKVVEETGQITDLRQSPSYARYMERIGWEVAQIGAVFTYAKRFPVLGYIIRIPRANLPLPLEEIDQLSHSKQAMIVKIEPNLIQSDGKAFKIGQFQKDNNPILPTRTIWIDLTKEVEKLMSASSVRARRHLRQANKLGIKVGESKEWKSFYELWEANAKTKGFFEPFEKELGIMWEEFREKYLLTATYEDRIVGGILLLGYKEAVYYVLAMSTEEGRQVHAPYLLLWEAIKRSKKWGYARLDLEGISDPEGKLVKSWMGFSHFKKGFGGQEIQYAGSFSKSYSILGKLLGRFL